MRLWLKITLGVFAVALLGVVGFLAFREPITWRAYDAVVKRGVTADPVGELPDGLHVYLCGTGSPMPDNRTAGACIGVLAGNQGFVFDAGSGSIRKLGRMGFPMGELEGAFLTHLHSDHIDGLGELLLMAWIGQHDFRSEPLPVTGPEGTATVVNGFNAAYSLDRGYRIAHHGNVANPAGYGGRAIEIALPAGPSAQTVVYDDAGVTITAIRVDHAPIEPAFGYRVDYKGRSISLSGDTVFHPGFVAASEGVDVMFHEALDPEMVKRLAAAMQDIGRTTTAKLLNDITDYHATPEDAARAAAEAGASELVFYHIAPPLPVRALQAIWLGDAKDLFSGRITVGEDGMLISLPAGRESIIHSRGF